MKGLRLELWPALLYGASVRLHLSLPKFTMKKITQLQGLFAHQKLDLAEIVDLMADALLDKKKAALLGIKLKASSNGQQKKSQEKNDREQKTLPKEPMPTVRKSSEGTPARQLFNEQASSPTNPSKASNLQGKAHLTSDPQINLSKSGRTIPIEVRRGALARADFKCENCCSTFALQFEHRIPVALGGRSTAENVLLLCRGCNLREDVKIFGVAGMGAC